MLEPTEENIIFKQGMGGEGFKLSAEEVAKVVDRLKTSNTGGSSQAGDVFPATIGASSPGSSETEDTKTSESEDGSSGFEIPSPEAPYPATSKTEYSSAYGCGGKSARAEKDGSASSMLNVNRRHSTRSRGHGHEKA